VTLTRQRHCRSTVQN